MQSKVIRFSSQTLVPTDAHDGKGEVLFRRVLTQDDGSAFDFVDMTIVPPGCSVGLHTHEAEEEEHYFIFAGRGVMVLDDKTVTVQAGDLVVNRPGGTHSLENPGPLPLKMVVWQATRRTP
ncbi:MAG: cupin domain-containing protein [Alphaproteobacteria bacterium]|nr:cupin domain-containing protein [Alphaproteobacteria bacterium]